MEYNIYFNNLCVELDVPAEPTREQLITAFINKVGGPDALLNLFVKKCVFYLNSVQDVNTELILNNNDSN